MRALADGGLNCKPAREVIPETGCAAVPHFGAVLARGAVIVGLATVPACEVRQGAIRPHPNILGGDVI